MLEERQGEGNQDAASHVVHLEIFDEGDLDDQPAARPAVSNINAGSERGSNGRCGVPSQAQTDTSSDASRPSSSHVMVG